jgi:hypothetical protein
MGIDAFYETARLCRCLPAFRRYFIGNMILILGWQMQSCHRLGDLRADLFPMALGYAGLAQFPQVLFM